jgi:hypothetical protein
LSQRCHVFNYGNLGIVARLGSVFKPPFNIHCLPDVGVTPSTFLARNTCRRFRPGFWYETWTQPPNSSINWSNGRSDWRIR